MPVSEPESTKRAAFLTKAPQRSCRILDCLRHMTRRNGEYVTASQLARKVDVDRKTTASTLIGLVETKLAEEGPRQVCPITKKEAQTWRAL